MKSGMLEQREMRTETPPLRVLIVEDSPRDVEIILLELRDSGFEIGHKIVENETEFRAAIEAEAFDAVICDYRLPSWTGMDAMKALHGRGMDVPFLLITGTLGEEAAVECIKQGVNDYILKERISRLPAALRRAVAEKRLRDENIHANNALRVSEMRNRDLVEHSVYGIFRAGGDGTFLSANPALLAMLGCDSFEEIEVLNLEHDVFRFPEQYAQLLASCQKLGQMHGVETEWRRKDGGLVAVRLHVRKVSDSEKRDSIEVMAEDVTELRAMERQLRQAQKFEAIGQLAGGVAHDFNNVVGAILGWAELGFEQSRENPQAADRFTRIREQAERAAALTRELLMFARRQALQPKAVDLNAVTGAVTSLLDKVIGENIEIKVLNAQLDPVKADQPQIEQVMMNLCINARDAMPEGGRLQIETEMVDLDDSYCRFYPQVKAGRYGVLSVSDTGKGMDAETRERIFEPFFTTKESGTGTGMGLATAYGIVRQHGGFIHVYSEPTQGSLFRVYLPILEGAAKGGTSKKVVVPSMAAMRGTETILIAEDHESIREMARQTLVGLGYRVLAACDGEEALRLCGNEVPELAILDVVMPKLGGPAAAVKLKERSPGLPILFTSGYSQESEGIRPFVTSAKYLQKPYSPIMLGRLVREILGPIERAKN
jgi:two-component system cell cycle sensor histidine kinase/response regulator CckA